MGLVAGWFLAGLLATSSGSSLLGDWRTPGGSVIRVASCGDAICMNVVKVAPDATETQDKLNPDLSLRTRPLCGLRIGEGFRPETETSASGGKVYDPESGKTYSGKVERKGDTLRLRGFIGVSMFGRTEVWSSIPAIAACKPS